MSDIDIYLIHLIILTSKNSMTDIDVYLTDLIRCLAEEKRRRKKPSVLVALINCMAMLRLKMEVAVSAIPPTTLVAVPKMPPTIPPTPPLAVETISLKSNTFLLINTTVPFISSLFPPKIPNTIFLPSFCFLPSHHHPFYRSISRHCYCKYWSVITCHCFIISSRADTHTWHDKLFPTVIFRGSWGGKNIDKQKQVFFFLFKF